MEITYEPRDVVKVNGARIVFCNFAGRPDKFNPKGGKRKFSLVIPDIEIANELLERGWNVTIKPPREDGEDPFCYLDIKVGYHTDKDGNPYGPEVYLDTNGKTNMLNEETIACLDRDINIKSVDLDFGPYYWTDDDGKRRKAAYLRSIWVTQEVSRFAERVAKNKYQRLADLLEEVGREEAIQVFTEVFGE